MSVNPRKPHFWLPWKDPGTGAIATKIRDGQTSSTVQNFKSV